MGDTSVWQLLGQVAIGVWACILYGAITGTLHTLHLGVPLWNPFFPSEMTKTAPWRCVLLTALVGIGVALGFILCIYCPSQRREAFLAGFFVMRFVHSGDLDKIGEKAPWKAAAAAAKGGY